MGGQVVMAYGVPKLGKTVDMGFSFPKALYLAMPGALDSIESTCGYTPDREEVRTVQEATERIKKLVNGKKLTHTEVVVDDFTVMAEQTMNDLEGKVAKKDFWQKNGQIVLEFRNAVRWAGVFVALTCWEAAPTTTKEGVFTPGGPQLAGKLRAHVPGLADIVLRAVHEPQRQPWPIAYRCAPDPRWISGERNDVVQKLDPAPMNMRELMNAARVWNLPRLWPEQEAQVEEIAVLLLAQPPEAWVDIAETLYAAFYERYGRARAVWTIRDALDRATIRRGIAIRERTFFAQKPAVAGATTLAAAAAQVGKPG